MRKLAAALREQGHQVSHQREAEALRELGYSLQGNRKTRKGASHPDRDARFAHLTTTADAFLEAGDSVILQMIAATTTDTGLTVESYLDTNTYPSEGLRCRHGHDPASA